MSIHPSLLLLLITFPITAASGPDAHAVVAELAEQRIADKTRKDLSTVMGDGYRLARAASWFDTMKATRSWMDQRNEAVKFLIHLVADAHMPLNAGRTADQGGDTINVHINFADFTNVNLHKAWEEKILDEMEGALYPESYVQQDASGSADRMKFWRVSSNLLGADLDQRYAGKVPSWLAECTHHGINACIDKMLTESADLACRVAYRHIDGRDIQTNDGLTREYYTSRVGVLQEQLAKAAARLAWIMDYAFRNFTGTTTTPNPSSTTTRAPGSTKTPSTTGQPGSFATIGYSPFPCFSSFTLSAYALF
ncbi:hypothetical protein FOZ60_001809 [Perkinsus olseni]|uniref:S1/P1 nuclease n=1 Tax=Perkinsus olseni TaxID=32597 RepID=A0A7J6P0H4_PEROL|nr:hypothetical protein FOZ60_001809 [Perkinsus olseni]